MPGKRISEFLNDSGGVGDLMPQATQLLLLREIAAQVLPANLHSASCIANCKQGVLTVFATNNAVAAKLRFYSARLITACAARGLKITEAKIEVQPAPLMTAALSPKRPGLTPAATVALQRLFDTLPESELREQVRVLMQKRR